MNLGLIKNRSNTGAVNDNRIVCNDPDVDFSVKQAAAVTTAIAGVVQYGQENQARVDVVMTGIADVEYGGDVKNGDPLVSDAQGMAIKFAVASHADDALIWLLGIAQEDGSAGTIGSVFINPQLIVK
jgi:hypothetical protein